MNAFRRGSWSPLTPITLEASVLAERRQRVIFYPRIWTAEINAQGGFLDLGSIPDIGQVGAKVKPLSWRAQNAPQQTCRPFPLWPCWIRPVLLHRGRSSQGAIRRLNPLSPFTKVPGNDPPQHESLPSTRRSN